MAPSNPIPPARALAFMFIAVWIVLSPGLVQVLGLQSRWIRTWRMYHSVGTGTCSADYYQRTPGGDLPIDRFLVLRDTPWWRLKPTLRRLEEEDLATVGSRLCRKLAAIDVRADAQCASRQEWNAVMTREDNLCRRPASR